MKNHRAENTATRRMFRLSSVEAPNHSKLGLDEELEHNQQRHDAAEVPHAPAEAADLADVLRGGDLGEHGVVVDAGELEEHVRQGDQRDAEQQELRAREHEEAQRGQEGDGGGVDPQPQLPPPAGVRALPGDRGQQRDGEPGDGQGAAQDGGGLVLAAEGIGGQVHGEDERGHDRVEGGRTPVPRCPGEDAALAGRPGFRIPVPRRAAWPRGRGGVHSAEWYPPVANSSRT